MLFEIDMVSDLTYFNNLVLSLPEALDKCIGVKHTPFKKFLPLSLTEINEWERTQGVLLPDDLQSFYLSSDGYLFEWTYPLETHENAVGKVHVNSLENLVQVYGYETSNKPGVTFKEDRYFIKLAPESKLFELSPLPNGEQVVLVYLYPSYVPTIWLLSANKTLFYLANDIATYLRMAIVHLGIPNWQLRYTSMGVPQSTENLFRLLLPDLLKENIILEKMIYQKKDESLDVPINLLNPNVFDPNTYVKSIIVPAEVPVVEPEKLEKHLRFDRQKYRKPKRKPAKSKKKCEKKSVRGSTFSLLLNTQ